MQRPLRVRGRSLSALAGAMILATSGAQGATPIVELGELKGAHGVNVDGAVYDVEFVEGTCIDVFDGCDEASDFGFADLAAAQLASQALQDQVFLDGGAGNFDSVPNLTFGCSGSFCGAVTPFGVPDATNTSVISSINFVAEASDVYGNGSTARTYDTGSSNLDELSVYVVWTPVQAAAPLPALAPVGHGLLIIALAGAVCSARMHHERRCQQRPRQSHPRVTRNYGSSTKSSPSCSLTE